MPKSFRQWIYARPMVNDTLDLDQFALRARLRIFPALHSACDQRARRPDFPNVCRPKRTRCLRLRSARPCPPRWVTSFESGDSAPAMVFSGPWPRDAMRQHGQELRYACASQPGTLR